MQTKKLHLPVVDRTPLEPPPIVVAVVGPPKVGKSTLISSLVKNYSRQTLTDVKDQSQWCQVGRQGKCTEPVVNVAVEWIVYHSVSDVLTPASVHVTVLSVAEE